METRSNASGLHLKTLAAIKELFPFADIRQEYKIKNQRTGRTLWLDFYIHGLGISVEVQGSQHEQYSDFFHNGLAGFQRQKNNDGEKALWCEENGIKLIKVYYNEDITKELLLDKINKI